MRVMVSVALFVTPRYDADTVADVLLFVAAVLTANVLDVVPAAMVTLAGAAADAVFELANAMTAPPEGAAAVSVTVALLEEPPATREGLSDSVESAAAGGGVTVNVVVFVTPAYAAESVVDVIAVTGDVAMAKLAAFVPSAIVTLPGTEATLLALDSDTTAPPDSAAEVNVTVPVEPLPPTTELGLALMPLNAAAPEGGFHPS